MHRIFFILFGFVACWSWARSFRMFGSAILSLRRPKGAIKIKGVDFQASTVQGRMKCALKTVEYDAVLQPEQYIKSIFGELSPSVALFDRSVRPEPQNDAQCIINDPEITMSNPLLGLNLTSLTEKVLDVAKERPCYRMKPLMATVRGTGGGKTRLLEEIRQNLQKDSTVLPIAITFTELEDLEFETPCASCSAALSIIARMASAFYGHSFKEVHQRMWNALPQLESEPEVVILYVAFVQLMREQMQLAGCPVQTFVLLLDETVKLQEKIKSFYPIHSNDPLSDLRAALLAEMPNAALVLSSLDAAVKGIYIAGRPLVPLLQCEALDPHQIVTEWWNIQDKQLQFRLQLIAAALCDMPRALETANTYIQENRAQISAPEFCEALVCHVKAQLGEHYLAAVHCVDPSPMLLQAMLFKSDISLDENVSVAIQASVLTNVLATEIGASAGTIVKRIVPRVNLFMFALLYSKKSNIFLQKLAALFDEVLTSTLASPDAGAPRKESAGDILALHTALMLNARVGVCMNNDATVTLVELLGLAYTRTCIHSHFLRRKMKLTVDMASDWTDQLPTLRHRSNLPSKEKLFLQDVQAIEVSANRPLVLWRGAAKDGFDLLIKAFDPTAPGQCQYVFLNSRSKRERENSEDSPYIEFASPANKKHFPDKGAQATKLCNVMSQIEAATTYVYLNTDRAEQTVYQPPEHPQMLWVCAAREQTQKFMGPLWDLHRAYREGCRDLPQPQPQQQ